jgi:superfamily II DNA or RNA helicase
MNKKYSNKRLNDTYRKRSNISNNINKINENEHKDNEHKDNDYDKLLSINLSNNQSPENDILENNLDQIVTNCRKYINNTKLTIKKFQAICIDNYRKYNKNSGYFSLASSSGKTFLIFLLFKEEKNKCDKTSIIVTSSKILMNQLEFKIKNFCKKENIITNIILYNSKYSSYDNTLNILNKNKNLIITSYEDIQCIDDIIKKNNLAKNINIIIFDEAHNITKSKNDYLITKFYSRDNIKRVFLTSTPIINNSKYSFNNKDIFGDLIYEYTCASAIKNNTINNWITYEILVKDLIIENNEINTYSNYDELTKIKSYFKTKYFDYILSFSKLSLKYIKDNNINSIIVYSASNFYIKVINYCYKFWCLQNNIQNNIIKHLSYTGYIKLNLTKSYEKYTEDLIKEFKNDFIGIKILITNNLDEGIELSNCNCVVFMFPKKSQSTISQNIGRCIRKNSNDLSHLIYSNGLFDKEQKIYSKKSNEIKKVNNNLLNITSNLYFES